MSISISIEKSRKSRLRRLSFLPRFGFYLDFGGRQLAYRQTPLLETVFNMSRRRLSARDFFDVAMQQLCEVDMPKQKKVSLPGRRKKK